MKKIILIFLSITSMLMAEFGQDDVLSPEEAFKTSIQKMDDNIEFRIQMDETIYVYDEFLSVEISNPGKTNITKLLKLPKPVEYDGFIVHFNELGISVPEKIVKDKIGNGDYELSFKFQGCSKKGLCYPPITKIFKGKIGDLSTEQGSQFVKSGGVGQVSRDETGEITQTLKNGNILLILSTFFGFGLLLALTPCVFPMIPILSGIIVQQSKQNEGEMSASRGFFLSLVYVLSMSAAYTIAGVLAGLFGANLQAQLQNPIVLLFFSSIFVALAFSMFGYFELKLPQSWQTKINNISQKGESKGGIYGVAIMGFLSALIVGPCVAPPLAGALAYIGQTGNALLGGIALFVMSLGMGAPLLLIGAGAGKYIPKPGGWMSVVSKIFGIIMLFVALWMLERIISPVLFMFLASFLLIGTALYLKEFKNIITALITVLIFTYGITIFVGALADNTNILNPLENFTGNSLGSNASSNSSEIKWEYVKTKVELDLLVENSEKPVMVDFWASWCSSCKELEYITFKNEEVLKELEKYKLVKVDITKNTDDDKALMKHFNLFGPPALIFYENKNEIKAKRVIGYKNSEDFLKIIRQ